MAKNKRKKPLKGRRYRDVNANLSAVHRRISPPFGESDYYKAKEKWKEYKNELIKRRVKDKLPIDRRFWRPDLMTGYYLLSGVLARNVATDRTKKGRRTDLMRSRLAFEFPFKTVVCVRRKIRREVLFATRGAGRGRRVKPLRRWVEDSFIRC